MGFTKYTHIAFGLLILTIAPVPLTTAVEESVCAAGDDTCSSAKSDEGTKKYYVDKEKKTPIDISKTSYIAQSGRAHDEYEDTNSDEFCFDDHTNCQMWAERGECDTNPGFMKKECQFSCFTCNNDGEVEDMKESDVVEDDFDFGAKYGEAQSCEGEFMNKIIQDVKDMEKYMEEEVADSIRPLCKNKHDLCTYWAHVEECTKNEGFMSKTCGPACRKCD
eukprot:CAMPEP_0198249582 /NCGR_PEP_ID=MMETSP1447-20131203/1069_1 /TAXON_ID=420782 /ORGANISM="Chaetoceros dichaeta, Strain CCMP1751" /LENGTH=219 /DNA_ID=CAMNT_0043934255 /DNA_START=79 /DNA_END=738 /DNA_ORIENTATION=+